MLTADRGTASDEAVRRRSRPPFSWPLALVFIGTGVLAGAVAHFSRADFDEAGFVRSPDGLRLAYELQGHGRPLVLLAGGPGISHHGFHPHLGLLRDAARIVYFDPRGRGESDTAPAYHVRDDVGDIEALRTGLGFGRIALLGVSYGAHLAVAYALARPEAVDRLVLVSPLVGVAAWRGHLAALARAPGMPEALADIRASRGEVRLEDRESLERITRILLPLYWCEVRSARRASSVFRRRHFVARQNLDVYEAVVGRPFPELNGDLAGSDVDGRLGALRAPVLIVHGACDRTAPPETVLALERALARPRRVVLPGSGHAPLVEEPHRFAEVVRQFLERE